MLISLERTEKKDIFGSIWEVCELGDNLHSATFLGNCLFSEMKICLGKKCYVCYLKS